MYPYFHSYIDYVQYPKQQSKLFEYVLSNDGFVCLYKDSTHELKNHTILIQVYYLLQPELELNEYVRLMYEVTICFHFVMEMMLHFRCWLLDHYRLKVVSKLLK